jgi:hypothetical protein
VIPFASSYWIIKGVGFTIGVGFFGEPIFAYTLDMLNRKVPNWKDHLDMQKYVPLRPLSTTPTNNHPEHCSKACQQTPN